jgi:hypothetical protein
MPKFEELPFDIRPDLTKFLIHLTKNTKDEDDYTAFNNLVNILKEGEIWGSGTEKGFIKGPNKATCFMDVPMTSLKYILNNENANPLNPRYEPFGILVTKKAAYKKGCRPVIYLSNNEARKLKIPREELWRVVRLEVVGESWINWMHEREWRCKNNFKLPKQAITVFVRHANYANKLHKMINKNPDKFKCKPLSIVPLSVICEGLPYL